MLGALAYKGRDNARIPMPWDASPGAGFTTGTPWLDVHPLSAPSTPPHRSTTRLGPLALPRLIALRHAEPCVAHGDFRMLLADHPQLYCFERLLGDRLLVVANLSSAADMVPDLELAACGRGPARRVRPRLHCRPHRPARSLGVPGLSTEIGETAGPTRPRRYRRSTRWGVVTEQWGSLVPRTIQVLAASAALTLLTLRRAAGGGGRLPPALAGRDCGGAGTRASRPRPGARRRHGRAARVPVPSRDGGTGRSPAQGARARDAGVLEEGAGVPGHPGR